MRAEVAAPLIEQATIDGTAYLAGRERMWETETARASAGRLRTRAASRAAAEAAGEHRATEDAVRRRWGSLPTGAGGLESWAERVAGKQADARATETRKDAEQAHREQSRMVERHLRESIALSQRALAGSTPSRVIAHAAKLRMQAERDRRDLARIEALPATEAAQLVRDLNARAEAAREAAERARCAWCARRSARTVPTLGRPRQDGAGAWRARDVVAVGVIQCPAPLTPARALPASQEAYE